MRSGRFVLLPYDGLPRSWDAIPDARGSTPQSRGFRNHSAQLQSLHTGVFGLSAQSTDYQREVQARLHLPFQRLRDRALRLKRSLELPTLVVEGMALYKRLTLVVEKGRIVKVFYPVFPPTGTRRRSLLGCGASPAL